MLASSPSVDMILGSEVDTTVGSEADMTLGSEALGMAVVASHPTPGDAAVGVSLFHYLGVSLEACCWGNYLTMALVVEVLMEVLMEAFSKYLLL